MTIDYDVADALGSRKREQFIAAKAAPAPVAGLSDRIWCNYAD